MKYKNGITAIFSRENDIYLTLYHTIALLQLVFNFLHIYCARWHFCNLPEYDLTTLSPKIMTKPFSSSIPPCLLHDRAFLLGDRLMQDLYEASTCRNNQRKKDLQHPSSSNSHFYLWNSKLEPKFKTLDLEKQRYPL